MGSGASRQANAERRRAGGARRRLKGRALALQNRVTPLGELVAATERGLVYGNRGCLHDSRGVIRRRWATRRWIACRLRFRGRRRSPLLAPGRYTELFFLDEATALAAGHRPCSECRHADYRELLSVWEERHPGLRGADQIDAQLHAERIEPRTGRRRLHEVTSEELPSGAFVVWRGAPHLVLDGALLPWSPAGYGDAEPCPARTRMLMLTPPSLAALLHEGRTPLVPFLHPSAEPAHRGLPAG